MVEKKKLKIQIFNKEYSLLVDNEAIALQLANEVNAAMEETKASLPDQSNETVAVLTAFNIAYDLKMSEKRQAEENAKAIEKLNKIGMLFG